MTTVRQTGNTVEVAIEHALHQLKVSRNDVEVEVLSAGKKGFLGFGAKDAEVIVTVKERPEVIVEPRPKPIVEAQPLIEEAEEAKVQEKLVKAELPKVTETEQLIPEVEENPIDKMIDYLTSVAKAMEIEDLVVTVTAEGKYLYVQMDSEKAALIIGKRGQTLNALQQLAQLIANQHSKQFKVVRLNVGDYRERREQSLSQLATRMADKAIETGRRVQLEPMPSYERKVLHHTLADRIDIETYSEGSDPHRYLVIEPIQ